MDNSAIQTTVKNWVDKFIIAHNICPFARKEMLDNKMRYLITDHIKTEESLQTLIKECQFLDVNEDLKTSLIIFKQGVDDFAAFLDLLEYANDILIAQDYEGVYQLASFHPQYQFDNTAPEDAENFSNKAPYPIFHLIREIGIEEALKSYDKPENIPKNNIKKMNAMGTETLQKILTSCHKT